MMPLEDLQGLILMVPTRDNPVLDPPSCISPWQPTICLFGDVRFWKLLIKFIFTIKMKFKFYLQFRKFSLMFFANQSWELCESKKAKTFFSPPLLTQVRQMWKLAFRILMRTNYCVSFGTGKLLTFQIRPTLSWKEIKVKVAWILPEK